MHVWLTPPSLVAIFFALAIRGAVAQLGERLNGIQEVVGSIPIGSTNSPRYSDLANVGEGLAPSREPARGSLK